MLLAKRTNKRSVGMKLVTGTIKTWVGVLVSIAPSLLLCPQSLQAQTSPVIQRPVCPTEIKSLADALAKDLPSYLNRTYTRLKFKTQVQSVGLPELEPLPLAAGSLLNGNPPDPNSDPKQVFLAVRERQAGSTDLTDRAYWLFFSQTKRGWRLAMAFTRIEQAPPQDVSDGVIAISVHRWLIDRCPITLSGADY